MHNNHDIKVTKNVTLNPHASDMLEMLLEQFNQDRPKKLNEQEMLYVLVCDAFFTKFKTRLTDETKN
jgi:hypothetical protein